MFRTGEELAAHLSQFISDDTAITQAVRKQFPNFGRAALSEPMMKAEGYKKPMSRFDPWMSSDAADMVHKKNMKLGSERLLTALWMAHPRIMKHLGATVK